jgi:hypothetical protein
MEKVNIQDLIKKRSDRITTTANDGRSEVWSNFVLVKLDGKLVEFVKCTHCNVVLKWKSRDGTSGLRTHVKSCSLPSQSGDIRITDLPGFHELKTSTKLPSSVKSDLADEIVRMCAKDIRYVNIFGIYYYILKNRLHLFI